MGKIFVRERSQIGVGEGQPRFRIVAASDTDVRVFVPHLRRAELEQIASASGAEIVYLAPGDHRMGQQGREGREGPETGEGGGHGRGQGGGRGRRAMPDQG